MEGMRSLTCFTAFCFDKIKCADSEEEKEYYRGLTEILTPVVKAYCSEKGFEVCVTGMQIFGGYGYTKEYPMEQLVRDCKICSIYEGSNGIQAMDFLGRKINTKNGALLNSLVSEIKKTVEMAEKCTDLYIADKAEIDFHEMGKNLEKAAEKFHDTAMDTVKAIKSSQFKSAFSAAHPLMDAAGDIIMAWMLLWRAAAAAPALKKIADDKPLHEIIQKNKNAAFYHGKIMTAQFFITTMLPVTMGKLNAVNPRQSAAVNINEKSF